MSKKLVGNKKRKDSNGLYSENKNKPQKVRGQVPSSYKPREKSVIEKSQTDPMILWNGWVGTVEIQGMLFRLSKNKINDGRCRSPQIFVLSAPPGTELYGLAGSSIFVTAVKLRMPIFRSNFIEGSVCYKRQERLWNFLNKIFLDLGLKKASIRHQNTENGAESKQEYSNKKNTKVLNSVGDLALGVLGRYSFEKSGEPRAYFQVKTMEYTNKKTFEKKHTIIIEALSISPGHKLYDHVRTTPMKTFVFYNQLFWSYVPNFNGRYAGDSMKMWEFLTGLIAKHHNGILDVGNSILVPDHEVYEDSKVIYLDERRVA